MKKPTLYLLATVLSVASISFFISPPPKQQTSTKKNTEQSHRQNSTKMAALTMTEPAAITEAQPESLSTLIKAAFPDNDPAWAWDKVDMAALQQQLPGNLYWEMSIPTDDELILEQRKETRDYWSQQRGKVVATTASELEINDYYDYQQQLSTDYVEFATALLKAHKADLPARDVQLMNLVRSMHSTRLSEYPSEREQALSRQLNREQERNAWLADKEAYEARLRMEIEPLSK